MQHLTKIKYNFTLQQLAGAFNKLRVSDNTEKNSAAVDVSCDSKGEVNNSTEETENNTRVENW